MLKQYFHLNFERIEIMPAAYPLYLGCKNEIITLHPVFAQEQTQPF